MFSSPFAGPDKKGKPMHTLAYLLRENIAEAS